MRPVWIISLSAGLACTAGTEKKSEPPPKAHQPAPEFDQATTPPADDGAAKPEVADGKDACGPGQSVGDSWKDDCNTCTCTKGGEVQCTMMACNVDDAG
jgi:hypothetical protein